VRQEERITQYFLDLTYRHIQALSETEEARLDLQDFVERGRAHVIRRLVDTMNTGDTPDLVASYVVDLHARLNLPEKTPLRSWALHLGLLQHGTRRLLRDLLRLGRPGKGRANRE
jgi:hypothetical protein